MWMTACPHCDWTSGKRFMQEAAAVLGQLHVQDHLGHTVTLKEVGDTSTAQREPLTLQPGEPVNVSHPLAR